MPDTWRPTDKHRKYAAEHGLHLDVQRQKFIAHAEEKDRRAASWNGAFSRWLINAVEYQRKQPQPHLRAVSGGYSGPYRNPPESAYDEPMYPEEGR